MTRLFQPAKLTVPCTAIAFQPETNASATKNILIAGFPDGRLLQWHATTGQILHSFEEDENQILALDYFKDATQWVSAGSDCKLRVYDQKTCALKVELESG